MEGLLRWINGWVYDQFGAEGLVFYSAHPYLYGLAALVLLAVLAGALAWWLSRRFRALLARLRLTATLLRSRDGRRCLRSAREIRRGGVRLRRAIRGQIESRSERRALLAVIDRFTRVELPTVLEQAGWLIGQADDRRERQLRQAVERGTQAWVAARSDDERRPLELSVAALRQQLARLEELNGARTGHLDALSAAAAAVHELERELLSLGLSRARALPEFREQLGDVARRIGDLRQAYRELDAPR